MKKVLPLLLSLFLLSCSSSDDGGEEAISEYYTGGFLDIEPGMSVIGGGTIPGKETRTYIMLTIQGNGKAKLVIESQIKQGDVLTKETSRATGTASSTKFTLSKEDTLYTCTRQSAEVIHLERTAPTYKDYNTLDKQ
jgi:thiamine monophosphate kinase